MSDIDLSARLTLILDDLQNRIDQHDAQLAANEAAAPGLEEQFPGVPLGLQQPDPKVSLWGISAPIMAAQGMLADAPDAEAQARLDALITAIGERGARVPASPSVVDEA